MTPNFIYSQLKAEHMHYVKTESNVFPCMEVFAAKANIWHGTNFYLHTFGGWITQKKEKEKTDYNSPFVTDFFLRISSLITINNLKLKFGLIL